MFGQWRRGLRIRFADREDLGKTGVYRQYWSEFPERAVMELFELIEMEYELPPGLLRPNDSVAKLVDPVKTANPFKWLFYQGRTEDRTSEINYQLGKRQWQSGTQKAWEHSKIRTVNDLIRAWCGVLPLTTPQEGSQS
jgi:hypothetical protein